MSKEKEMETKLTYTVEPPAPGERATLLAMYHLDDL